jgi:hypothetical protein
MIPINIWLFVKVRERMTVIKHVAQIFDAEIFNLRELNVGMLGKSIILRLQTGLSFGDLK